jgi:hypothetical protein
VVEVGHRNVGQAPLAAQPSEDEDEQAWSSTNSSQMVLSSLPPRLIPRSGWSSERKLASFNTTPFGFRNRTASGRSG